MSIYKDLDAITDVAVYHAKEYGVNYNIILFNPDENGRFSEERGSTCEYVADSYFEKERPNVILLKKTDDIIEAQERHDRLFGPEPMMITNSYVGDEFLRLDDHIDDYRSSVVQYTRDTPKMQNNEPCPCGSGSKFKKCCK